MLIVSFVSLLDAIPLLVLSPIPLLVTIPLLLVAVVILLAVIALLLAVLLVIGSFGSVDLWRWVVVALLVVPVGLTVSLMVVSTPVLVIVTLSAPSRFSRPTQMPLLESLAELELVWILD